MTNVRLDWRTKDGKPATDVTAYPQPCPDVFVDRPVQLVAKLPAGFDGNLEVSGKVADGEVTRKFTLGDASRGQHDGIPTLFGQAVVNDLMYERLRTNDATELQNLHDKIVRTGIDYQLVTAFTSRWRSRSGLPGRRMARLPGSMCRTCFRAAGIHPVFSPPRPTILCDSCSD